MIVVDASVLIDFLFRTSRATAIEDVIFAPGETLHVPHLLDIEVTHVIRRYAANGQIDEQRGRAALDDLIDLPLQRYQHDLLLLRIWDLRHNLTAYDATYVALAELLDAPLLTRDQRLAAASSRHVRTIVP